MTSPRKSRSTLRRVERAAMRWYELTRPISNPNLFAAAFAAVENATRSLERACAAHAAAKAKRGKGK